MLGGLQMKKAPKCLRFVRASMMTKGSHNGLPLIE
jgi:hypothetical protein